MAQEEQITARFDTLTQAETVATKLRSIRIRDVEISEMDEGGWMGNTTAVPIMGYIPNSSANQPSFGGSAFGAPGLGIIPNRAMNQDHSPGQGYLLHSQVDANNRDMAMRIIRDHGGQQL